MKKQLKSQTILILDNIRSVQNVGAIFRTADAVGIKIIYLTGYTPTPMDRFNRIRNDITKSALGAEKTVLWEQIKNISIIINKLKNEGYFIVALEQNTQSVNYKKIKKFAGKKPIALIVGNEVDGILPKTLSKADIIMEIPMYGKKESLNVSVATGIALYGIMF